MTAISGSSCPTDLSISGMERNRLQVQAAIEIDRGDDVPGLCQPTTPRISPRGDHTGEWASNHLRWVQRQA